jgi:regulator of replication initiation timing
MAANKLTSTVVMSACVIATIATFFIKSKQVSALRAENEALRAEMKHARQSEAEQLRGAQASTDDLERLRREASEVHKLRGEVALLRRERTEVAKQAEENARLRKQLQSPPTPTEMTPEEAAKDAQKQIGIAKLNYLKGWTVAFHMFADKHEGNLPKDFEEAKGHLRTDFDPAFDPNQFEIVYRGSLKQLQGVDLGRVILVREREPTIGWDGRRSKAYGFADGHSEIHAEGPQGFDAWEKERMLDTPPKQ